MILGVSVTVSLSLAVATRGCGEEGKGGLENPPHLSIGNLSSFTVDVPTCHVSFLWDVVSYILGGSSHSVSVVHNPGFSCCPHGPTLSQVSVSCPEKSRGPLNRLKVFGNVPSAALAKAVATWPRLTSSQLTERKAIREEQPGEEQRAQLISHEWMSYPPRELTYPNFGKGKQSSKLTFQEIC